MIFPEIYYCSLDRFYPGYFIPDSRPREKFLEKKAKKEQNTSKRRIKSPAFSG
jgi:hypothetical protein